MISWISYIILFVSWLIMFCLYISCRKQCNKLIADLHWYGHVIDCFQRQTDEEEQNKDLGDLSRLSEANQQAAVGGTYGSAWETWICSKCQQTFQIYNGNHKEVHCPYCSSERVEPLLH